MTIRPMLASPAKQINFPVYASPKIDGIRAYVSGGQLLSRSGKKIPNQYVQDTLGHRVMDGIDGELCVGPSNDKNLMQKTTSGIMSFDGKPDFTYWIFDVWSQGHMPFDQRLDLLRPTILSSHSYVKNLYETNKIQFLTQVLIDTVGALNKYEKQCLEMGYEGIMVRDPKGTYKFGRSTAKEGKLLKVKRWTDSEANILGFNEFMHNANELQQDNFGYAKRSSHQDNKVGMNMLGSLVCRDIHSNQLVDIGTGFSHADRQEIWNNQAKYKKQIVKYKHFNGTGVKDAPRFPVFVGFRHPEDMS